MINLREKALNEYRNIKYIMAICEPAEKSEHILAMIAPSTAIFKRKIQGLTKKDVAWVSSVEKEYETIGSSSRANGPLQEGITG